MFFDKQHNLRKGPDGRVHSLDPREEESLQRQYAKVSSPNKMSDLKASPGPWEPDFSDTYEVTVKDAGGYDILKCIVEDEDILAELHKTPSEQKAANAYLSAAAPDMYRLLFDILTDWPSITTDKELRISTLASIEEVLRKARGETK